MSYVHDLTDPAVLDSRPSYGVGLPDAHMLQVRRNDDGSVDVHALGRDDRGRQLVIDLTVPAGAWARLVEAMGPRS